MDRKYLKSIKPDTCSACEKEKSKEEKEERTFTGEEYAKGLLVRFGLTEKEADEEINSYNEYLKQQ